jgi:glucose/mannose transport system substrate-binding protein
MKVAIRSSIPVLLLVIAGCGSESYEPPRTDTVEIFSWWTAGGESEALDAVLALHAESHPDTTIVNIAQDGGGTPARERLEERIRDDYPPEIFQTNFGSSSLQAWLEFNGPESATIQPLNDLFEEEGWAAAYPELLRDSVSLGSDIYAVPVNIHRTNSLFYNVKIFEDNGLEPPTTLEEFYAVGDALLALDPPIVPLAVGSEGAWTVNLLTMENLLITKAGPDYFKAFFTHNASPDDPEIADTLDELLKMWGGYVNENANELQWDAAVQMVADGDAAMTIMGDWAKGYLQAAGLTPGEDFGQMPTFGTQDAFVFTGDCFPLAAAAENVQGGLELLRTFGSKEAQDAFNVIKGSIPARIDADVSLYDTVAQGTINDFRSSDVTLVSSLSGLVPPAFGDAVVAAIPAMLDANDPEPVLNALRDNYDMLDK